jgi:hypothetical protein
MLQPNNEHLDIYIAVSSVGSNKSDNTIGWRDFLLDIGFVHKLYEILLSVREGTIL